MPKTTIGFGAVLIAIGLFGYFGSTSENPSPTALIPAAFGAVLAICGVVAHKPALRAHAMHAAATVALIGVIAAGIRLAPRFSLLFSDDLTLGRPVRMVFLMGLFCLIFVIMCIGSFIGARRRRSQGTGTGD